MENQQQKCTGHRETLPDDTLFICKCGAHQGCCRKHKSIRTPFPYLDTSTSCEHEATQTPSDLDMTFEHTHVRKPHLMWQKRLFAMTKQTSKSLLNIFHSSKVLDTESECTPLLEVPISTPTTIDPDEKRRPPPTPQSAHTLVPLHHLIPHHLSLDHLDCVRRQRGLRPGSSDIFIAELSDKGSFNLNDGPLCSWSSELYYTKEGTFLQKQNIDCYLAGVCKFCIHLAGCPHQGVQFSEFVLGRSRSLFDEFKTRIANRPHRCPTHQSETWSSIQGPYTHLTVCTICYSDAEYKVERNSRSLRLYYRCFKDLGPGVKENSSHPKWYRLLTGSKNDREEAKSSHGHCRPENEPDVLIRGWHTARKLRRCPSNDIIHQTANGPFQVNLATYPGNSKDSAKLC